MSDFSPSMHAVHFPNGPSFSSPVDVRAAKRLDEVWPVLEWARAEVASGRPVAGYIAYEAAPAFEPAFAAHPPGEMPLVWLASYAAASVSLPPRLPVGIAPALDWQPAISPEGYALAFAEIREHIAAGATYQVNYTFPLVAGAPEDPWGTFCALQTAQPVDFACYLNLGRWQVLSLSPELFFELRGGELRTRPMKGTRPRGLYGDLDAAEREALATSAKDRAENVMITDMLRNDMARISAPGSVEVEKLFEIEQYRTVWQMTSSIRSRTHADVPEVLAALFPSGSVTGAPKIQTSRIIRDLEPHARGVYCGAVGYWLAPGVARFNVAIRTMTVDSERGTANYHVGSGVTWDAEVGAEFSECLDKAAIVLSPSPPFELLETMRCEDGKIWYLEEHLARLAESAAYFGFRFSHSDVEEQLKTLSGRPGNFRIRMTFKDGGCSGIRITDLVETHGPLEWRVALSGTPVSRRNLFLYHKTTNRTLYEAALASRPDVDDVLLYNEDGELTESTIANLGVEVGGVCYTPPRACGLLAGTMRARLLAEGHLQERVLHADDLKRADRVFLFNSVRGEFPIRLEL